jgi:ABC-type sugar transport system substrate-binding protein
MKPASFLCCAFLASVGAGAPAPAAALQDQAVEVGPGITPPQAAGPLFIETPEGVNDANANATVTVRLLLDKSGRVR